MEAGTLIHTTQDPAELTIICDGDTDGSTIKLTGNTEFYGSIFAPNSTIQLTGTADYYGAIVGRTVGFGGTFAFHLDESLPLNKEMKDKVALVR